MDTGRSQGGRPRKSADLRKVTVSCRVTEAEWQYLSDLALNEGLSLNDLLRSVLLAGMPASVDSSSAGEKKGGVS